MCGAFLVIEGFGSEGLWFGGLEERGLGFGGGGEREWRSLAEVTTSLRCFTAEGRHDYMGQVFM